MSIRVNKGKFKINAYAKAVLTFIPPTPTPTATPTTTPTATVGTSPLRSAWMKKLAFMIDVSESI